MQRITNYGSFLQAYALKSTIENLGHVVEFVDYTVEKCIVDAEPAEDKKNHKKPFVRRATDFLTYRYHRFLGIFKKPKEKKLSEHYGDYLKYLNITDEYNYRAKVDTLVVGSDEVFNCLQTNPDVGYSKELFGANNNAGKVISYAASFGTTTVAGLKQHNIAREIGKLLSNFSALSVRDHNSGDVVSTLTEKTPVYHLDPVFIYDFDHLVPEKIDLKNYIVVYAYGSRLTQNENNAIRKFAKRYRKKIVCIGSYQACCDLFFTTDPFELLAYVKGADFIITDTFHGSVFSIKYNKLFATIVRDSNRQKLSDLLERFSLSNRIVDDIGQLDDVLTHPIDYAEINRYIGRQIGASIDYLKKNLS